MITVQIFTKQPNVKTKPFVDNPKKILKDFYDTFVSYFGDFSIKSISSTMSVDKKSDNNYDFINKNLTVNDWFLAIYPRKKTVKIFVSHALNISGDGLRQLLEKLTIPNLNCHKMTTFQSLMKTILK